MKQIYLHILAAAVAAVTLAACGEEDIELDAGNVAADFTATIEGGLSRAIGCSWEDGDEIGISTNISPTANCVYNVCHLTPDGDGKFTVKNSEDKIYYKATQVKFNAYYPYEYIDNISTTKTIDVNTSNQKEQKSFDFLFASATGTKTSPEVSLKFAHKLSKLTFLFKNGHGMDVSAIKYYELSGFVMDGTFNITTGGCSPKTTGSASKVKVELSEVEDSVAVAPCILIPQTAKSDPILEITDRDGNIYSCNLKFANSTTASTYRKIAAGTEYKFTITVNKTGLTVSNCTIENWIDKENTGWGAGTAGSADDPDDDSKI